MNPPTERRRHSINRPAARKVGSLLAGASWAALELAQKAARGTDVLMGGSASAAKQDLAAGLLVSG